MVPQFPSHCPNSGQSGQEGLLPCLPRGWVQGFVRVCAPLPPISFPPLPFIGCLLCTKPTASSLNPLHFLWVLRFACFTRRRARLGVMRKRPQQQDGKGGRQLESRVRVEGPGLQTPCLPKPAPSPFWASAPLPPSWPGSFPASLSSSSFLWVDRETGGVSFAVLTQGCAGRASRGSS